MNYAHIFIDLIVIVLVILSCNILCKLCEIIHSFCKKYTVTPENINSPSNTSNNNITPNNTSNNDIPFYKKNFIFIKNPYCDKLYLGIESEV